MHPATFELVTSPPAAIDRRALSQAWYDALHVAQRPGRTPAQRRPVAAASSGAQHRLARTEQGSRCGVVRAGGRAAVREPAFQAPARAWIEKRRLAALAEQIAARVRRTPAQRASFTLTTPLGRVVVFVHLGQRGALRLIALCAPGARERVDRALAQARLMLAAHGARLAW